MNLPPSTQSVSYFPEFHMKKLRVTVDGKVFDVTVEQIDEGTDAPPARRPVAATAAVAPAVASSSGEPSRRAGVAGEVPSPLAGKIVSVDVAVGQEVQEGKQVVTLEAMKMNTYVFAPRSGKVTAIMALAGTAVEEGSPLLVIA